MPDWLRLRRVEPGSRRVANWLLRGLGFLFFWALLSWWREVPGLIGPHGILPAGELLPAAQAQLGWWTSHWEFPSLAWLGAGTGGLRGLCVLGMAAALAVVFWPRRGWHRNAATPIGLAVCLVCFLSLVAVAQVFASYQSDGMLMTAGFLGLFVDPEAPNWWSLFGFRWLWFSIYFGSGIAKWLSHDPQWRHLTALDQYYQNLPLPNWIGWYVEQHLPHGVEAAFALGILITEIFVAWLAFGPRRTRIVMFWIATPMQLGIILTANYGFLNYVVLIAGLALIDDRHLDWLLRRRQAATLPTARGHWPTLAASCVLLALVAITGANLAHRLRPRFPAPERLTDALSPFRITDPFGLFAVMTPNRYEIEFQGTQDGEHWISYPFRYKPQNPARAPVGNWFLFAPYQPRFDWNLWFASLASYRNDEWVEQVELALLRNDPAVTALFAGNPFASTPPRAVRSVIWQYWFATPEQHRTQHVWWSRRLLGLYAPALAMTASGPEVLTVPER